MSEEKRSPDAPASRQTLKHGRDLAAIYQVEKADREELEIAYQTLNAVFASTPNALVVLDDTLVIQQANRAFGRLVEMAPESVVGRLMIDVFASDELIEMLQQLAAGKGEQVGGNGQTQIEIRLRRPVKRLLLAHIARLRAGRTQGWIVVLHEQSERARLENQKIEFINIAAHELRTPLSLMMGFTELLSASLEEKVSAEEQDALQAIKRGGERLRGIINELLEFAQVQEGNVEPGGLSNFHLSELVQDTVSDLQPIAHRKEVTLEFVPPDSELPLLSDARLLRTVLYQLILNGINFNKPDGRVQISLVSQADRVYVEISDTGKGIAQTDLDTIFGPFFQVEDHNTRHIGGLGLGLSMAHRAATQLGGRLAVESTLGEGSTFRLHLPRRPPEAGGELAQLRTRFDATYQQSLVYARHIQTLKQQLQRYFVATLAAMAEAIEARDGYTHGHTDRVTEMALRIARQMGYSEQSLRTLETAGRLQDIGKIGTPDTLLNKNDTLEPEEYEVVKQHITLGRKILEPLEFLQEVVPIAFSHHERWDGLGYPDGLAGEVIPLGGRILAVADAYNAITSPRSYRDALSREQALSLIRDGAGKQWDPDVVAVFLEMMEA